MKKTNVTISYEEEKLNALKMYLEQKGQVLEQELTAAVDTMYAKTVPSGVRDFIEMRSGTMKPTERKKKPKPTTPVTAPPPLDMGGER